MPEGNTPAWAAADPAPAAAGSAAWSATAPATVDAAETGASDWAHLVEALPVPLLVLDTRDRTVRFANPAASRHFGYSGAEFQRMGFKDLLPADDAATFSGLLREEVPEVLEARSRWRLRGRDGSFSVSHLGPPIVFQGRRARILWCIPAAPDRPAGGPLDPADLADFAFSAFHDLKEPLQLVKGYLHLVQQRALEDPDSREYVATAVDGTERMQALVLNLLEYFRVQSRTTQPEPMEAADAVGEALATLRLVLEETDAVVETRDLPRVWADRSQAVRLFQNLISNAVKFHGDQRPRVVVSATPAGPQWEFTVQDNGIGIPDGERERVFEPFHRLHSVDDFPGSGLGLSTCRGIVEAHGGRIWAVPTPGGGTTIRFTLPAEGP